MFVIRRNFDGKYAGLPGAALAYTANRGEARKFTTREEAERLCLPTFETVTKLLPAPELRPTSVS